MHLLKVLAVDDELLALRRLEIAMAEMADVDLVGTARGGEEALARIADLRPDVILLDIQMAGVGGFELIEQLTGEHIPLVIFVTAFANFAPRAFEVSAVDYVLKPVEFERLRAALCKARTTLRLADADQRATELRALVRTLRAQAGVGDEAAFVTEFWAERRGESVRVPVHQIDWMEADRDYVRLHAGGGPYLLRGPLSDLQARLEPGLFVRVRRSALVRADRIQAMRNRGYGDIRIMLAGGEELKVGKTYLREVRALFTSRQGNPAAR